MGNRIILYNDISILKDMWKVLENLLIPFFNIWMGMRER